MSQWVDFKSLKRCTPISRILDRYRIALAPSGSNTLRGRCPLPTHTSSSTECSFMVNTKKNVWSCHSQSCIQTRQGAVGGNILDLVSLLEGCSLRRAALLIQDWFGDPAIPPFPAVTLNRPADEPNARLSFRLRGLDYHHPYLEQRNIDPRTAKLFEVGFYAGPGTLSQRIVIPIQNEVGSLVAYAGRSIDGSQPRYRFPAGFRKGLEVFNLHRYIPSQRRRRVVVVEGFFDAMKVHQADFPVVALMGANMSQCQAELVSKHFSEVVLLLDGDDAGRSGCKRATEMLVSHLVEVRVALVPAGKQPDQLEAREIKGIIQCCR